MATPVLYLDAVEVRDRDHWRWVLKDDHGAFLADHVVALDRASSKYRGLFDLPGYLQQYAAPDKRKEEERLLARELGLWIAERLLGPNTGEAIAKRAKPVVAVRVRVPKNAEHILALPLDVAHFRGRPLFLQGVSFVFELAGSNSAEHSPVGERLRILALFSLPPAASALNLRRERQTLRSFVRKLNGAHGFAVDLRILQYGVTRERLVEVIEEEEGWDIIHFSGHGLPGSLILEKSDGQRDTIPSTDMADLLSRVGDKLKLVVLSACLSAAASINQTLAWLGAPASTEERSVDSASGVKNYGAANEAAPAVARALIESLGCAVLAMRYPVEEEFATALAGSLYESMLVQGQSLPRAAQRALKSAIGDEALAPDMLSQYAMSLFGGLAAVLTIAPPKNPSSDFAIRSTGLASFPREPDHFVGRVRAMMDASAALAVDSEHIGVLFHGMAGAGKTSCAVELAYHHQAAARFRAFVWYQAPEPSKDIALALRDFALAMELQLPLFSMVHVVDQIDSLKNWLPKLSQMLSDNAILIVLDNLESLLTDAGDWRDERWGLVVSAMFESGGLSRVLMTSRVRPSNLPNSTKTIAIHSLLRDEAVLLVREYPDLRRLLEGKAGVSRDEGRELVRRTLSLVQGHPKLIGFANSLAAEPGKLANQLNIVAKAREIGSAELDAFFLEGATRFDGDAFVAELHAWTLGIVGILPEPARIFFQFLTALEESDRKSDIIEVNWKDVWKRLERSGGVPSVDYVLSPLIRVALAEKITTVDHIFTVGIHPGVAEAVRAEAGAKLQDAVDNEMTTFWAQMMLAARGPHGAAPLSDQAVSQAGLRSFPYLTRQKKWTAASGMLEQVLQRDRSPSTLATVLPVARKVAEMAAGTDAELSSKKTLALALFHARLKPDAEALMREVIDAAVARGEFDLASVVAGHLVDLVHETDPKEALEILKRKSEYTGLAGEGEWSRLLDEAHGLRSMVELGQAAEVLERVKEMDQRMEKLPPVPAANDKNVVVWGVREAIFEAGMRAADKLGRWQDVIEFNSKVLKSKIERGAPLLEQARTQFNNYGPLLRLKKSSEARVMLDKTRQIFEKYGAILELGFAFAGLADLEHELGHDDEAKRFGETSLRYFYVQRVPAHVATGHHNLTFYIAEKQLREAIAHSLASMLISAAIGSLDSSQFSRLLELLLKHGDQEREYAFSLDFAKICETVARVDGVNLPDLMASLVADPQDILDTMLAILPQLLDASTKKGPRNE
jgi:hypothetical protein